MTTSDQIELKPSDLAIEGPHIAQVVGVAAACGRCDWKPIDVQPSIAGHSILGDDPDSVAIGDEYGSAARKAAVFLDWLAGHGHPAVVRVTGDLWLVRCFFA